GIDTPPGITALTLRFFQTPPQTSLMIWLNVVPIGSSNTPGLLTWPDTHTMRVPPDRPVPSSLNQAPPLSTMNGTFISVSTLLTIVGLPNRPLIAGNGGLSRGWPRKPSSELSSAVSSPQMYAPAPRWTVSSHSMLVPRMFLPR